MSSKDSYEEYLVEKLTDPKHAESYLEAALEAFQEDGSAEVLLLALLHLAKAQGGITELSEKTHLSRQALYKSLAATGNPSLKTFRTILNSLGFALTVHRIKNSSGKIRDIRTR